jgi:hypothetical protein
MGYPIVTIRNWREFRMRWMVEVGSPSCYYEVADE